jgi:hypothetical protein
MSAVVASVRFKRVENCLRVFPARYLDSIGSSDERRKIASSPDHPRQGFVKAVFDAIRTNVKHPPLLITMAGDCRLPCHPSSVKGGKRLSTMQDERFKDCMRLEDCVLSREADSKCSLWLFSESFREAAVINHVQLGLRSYTRDLGEYTWRKSASHAAVDVLRSCAKIENENSSSRHKRIETLSRGVINRRRFGATASLYAERSAESGTMSMLRCNTLKPL